MCYALLCVHSSFAIILKRKRKLAALLLLSYRCIVTINVLWLFLTVPWVGLQYVIVIFPDNTHFLIIFFDLKIVSEYDQEIPQSQTADNPVAPRGRAAQPSRDTRKTN